MAWNVIADIRHFCKECNRYRIFSPQDPSRKEKVLQELGNLHGFFDKKSEEFKQYQNPPMEPVLLTRQNKETCLKLIDECTHCDRTIDRVNREIVLLK